MQSQEFFYSFLLRFKIECHNITVFNSFWRSISIFMQKSLPNYALTSYPELGVLKLKPLCTQFAAIYCKVASTSWLVSIFRMFMKGKFDAYILWPFAISFQNWIVDRFTARDFTAGYLQSQTGYYSENKHFAEMPEGGWVAMASLIWAD